MWQDKVPICPRIEILVSARRIGTRGLHALLVHATYPLMQVLHKTG